MIEPAQAVVKPVLFVTTSHGVKGTTGEPTGYFLSEVTHPLSILERSGIRTEFASVKGGEPPVDGLELKDSINVHYWNDTTFRDHMRHTQCLADVDVSRFSAIFFPGGHGAMWDFTNDESVIAAIRQVYEAGGFVASVCHGPAALVNATLSDGTYLVKGKRVAAFTDNEERAVRMENVVPFLLETALKERGALIQWAPDWQRNVAVDERLITGQNPQSALEVGVALRDHLLVPPTFG